MRIVSDYPINPVALNEISAILEDYEILISRRISKQDTKVSLVDSTPKKCRFCCKSSPEVKFKRKSHTIPEFIGNKSLFSEYECDTCNTEYFKLFENEMANFMLPYSVISGVVGKGNKISKYKLKGQTQIVNGNNEVIISGLPDSVVIDLEKSDIRSYVVELAIPTFIPEFIYRCLIKIGLSIIPEEKLCIYRDTISWLMNPEIQSNVPPFMQFSMYPSHIQSNEIVCTVFEKKDNSLKNIPHSVLFLSFNNFAFQTCIPYSAKEILGVELMSVPFVCPMTLDLNKDNEGLRVNSIVDLSSTEKIRNAKVSYTMTW